MVFDLDKHLKQNYNLDPVTITDTNKGTYNKTFYINSSDNKQYVIKLYLDGSSIETIRQEITIYDYINLTLNNQGIFAPTIILSIDNLPTTKIRVGDKYFPVILMKLENLVFTKPSTITEPQIKLIAKSIARLHQQLKLYPDIKLYSQSQADWWEMSTIENTAANFQNSPNFHQLPGEQGRHSLKLIASIISFLNRKKMVNEIEQTLLHGDLALEHLPFKNDHQIYIYDFTDRVYGPISRDLAVFSFHLYREDNITLDLWNKLFTNFLNGYRQIHTLTDLDLDYILPFQLQRIIDEINFISKSSIKSGQVIRIASLIKRIEFANYLFFSTRFP